MPGTEESIGISFTTDLGLENSRVRQRKTSIADIRDARWVFALSIVKDNTNFWSIPSAFWQSRLAFTHSFSESLKYASNRSFDRDSATQPFPKLTMPIVLLQV
jgi:hypothetical protein